MTNQNNAAQAADEKDDAQRVKGIGPAYPYTPNTAPPTPLSKLRAPVAGEAQPVAWLHQCRKKPELTQITMKKHEPALAAKGFRPVPLYAAPQASEAVRNAALEEAAHLMEQTGKRIAAADIRALKQSQAAQDGDMWKPQTPEQIVAAMRRFARSEGFDWPDPASAEYERGRADGWAAGWDQAQAGKDGGQQRAVDVDLYELAIKCGAVLSTEDLSWAFSYSAMRDFCIRAHAALSATQPEQGERDEG